MDRGVRGALRVDAQLQEGQRIQQVGAGSMLADRNCSLNWRSSSGTIT
jgi:hypothetical protein